MLKRVNKERVCCLVVFYEEIIAVFKLKNISNWHRNRQKTQTFQSFHANFVEFPIHFVDWNVENGQQNKNWLSSSLL